jgi:serine protease
MSPFRRPRRLLGILCVFFAAALAAASWPTQAPAALGTGSLDTTAREQMTVDAPVTAAAVLAVLPDLEVEAGWRRLSTLPVVPEVTAELGVSSVSRRTSGGVLGGVIVVRLAPGASAKGSRSELARAQAAELGAVARAPWRPGGPSGFLGDVQLVFLAADRDPQQAADTWHDLPGVDLAEPYFIHRLARTPDDPRLGDQRSLPAAGVVAAWDRIRGQDSPVPVAVVDGGMDITHPDLAANVLLNEADPPNGIDDDGNGYVDDYRGWNFGTGNDDPGQLQQIVPVAVRHGTHVAGIVSAVTDNGRGVAGTTWNGPILCVAANSPTADDNILFGYQGILYAAARGARIINCSWGRSGRTSLLETLVLKEVAAQGVAVVGAAGNEDSPEKFYPAAYPEVLGVANVDETGLRHFLSNYGPWVDLCAPGVLILSLFPDGQYGWLTGTSMSSPLVVGCAALMLGFSPELTPRAALHRLVLTARSVDAVNPAYEGMLGSGSVDLAAALAYTGPGYRLLSLGLSEEDGDGQLESGEEFSLDPVWLNELGAAVAGLSADLEILSGAATISSGAAVLPPLQPGQTGHGSQPYRLRIDAEAPVGSDLQLVWHVTGESGSVPAVYADRQRAQLPVMPIFADLATGDLKLTLCGNGRLGFAGIGGGNGHDGLGVRYVPEPPGEFSPPPASLLFEGAILLGTAPTRISDAARRSSQGEFDPDLVPLGAEALPRALPDISVEGRPLARVGAAFDDVGAADPLGVTVDWEALSPAAGDESGMAWVRVVVRNTGTDSLPGLRAGFFLDWDLAVGGTFDGNTTALDPAGDLATVYGSEPSSGIVVGTSLVAPDAPEVHFRAIQNENDPDNPSWGIYDGFDDTEKWQALSDPDAPHRVEGADVSQFWACGPFDLAAGDSTRFVLVMSAGTGGEQAASRARAGIRVALALLEEREPPPPTFAVGQPAPNPWNGEVVLPVSGVASEPWTLRVYDLRGRLVHDSGRIWIAGSGTLSWDGSDRQGRQAPSGCYLLRAAQAGQGGQAVTRRTTLVR